MKDSRMHFRCFYSGSNGTLLICDFLVTDLCTFEDLKYRMDESLPHSFDWCLEIDDLSDE